MLKTLLIAGVLACASLASTAYAEPVTYVLQTPGVV